MAERAGRRRKTRKAAPVPTAESSPAPAVRPAAPTDDVPTLVAIAEVARAHGLDGELRLRLYNPDSDLIERIHSVDLQLPDGTSRPVELLTVREGPGAVLVTIDGVGDRDAAEALRGAVLRVPRAALGEAEPDEYFVCDLERCRVLLDGVPFGSVERVAHYPTCDALVVIRPNGARLEVPMHEDFVAEVRLGERTVELCTIDGLE
jgi:16S rRNA processing protein RimM